MFVRVLVPLTLVVLALAGPLQGGARASDDAVVWPKIVGGEPAPAGSWPSMAGLRISIGGTPYLCGGTLIAPRAILTSAHCMFNPDGSVSADAALSTAIIGGGPLSTGAPITWQSYTIHPSYNPATRAFDIALVTLPAAIDAPLMPLLASGQEGLLTPGTPLGIAGYGATIPGDESSTSNILRQAGVPLVANDACRTAYANVNPPFDAATMLCAGYLGVGLIDACQGDSGGPIALTINGTRTLVGATSFGVGCAQANYPGVYARVSAVRSWVAAQPAVDEWLSTLTTTPQISVTNTGAELTVAWQAETTNWTLNGFRVTINDNTAVLGGDARSRTVSLPGGGPVTVAVQALVERGTGATATFAGTPAATRAPIISITLNGLGRAGTNLTAVASVDDPWATPLEYRWLRNGTRIPTATTRTFRLRRPDAGRTIRVAAVTSNAAGTRTTLATRRVRVGAIPLATTNRFTPRGAPLPGRFIAANRPPVTGFPRANFRYQWLRNGRPVWGATRPYYRVRPWDRGARIRVRIVMSNQWGSRTILSQPVVGGRLTR